MVAGTVSYNPMLRYKQNIPLFVTSVQRPKIRYFAFQLWKIDFLILFWLEVWICFFVLFNHYYHPNFDPTSSRHLLGLVMLKDWKNLVSYISILFTWLHSRRVVLCLVMVYVRLFLPSYNCGYLTYFDQTWNTEREKYREGSRLYYWVTVFF